MHGNGRVGSGQGGRFKSALVGVVAVAVLIFRPGLRLSATTAIIPVVLDTFARCMQLNKFRQSIRYEKSRNSLSIVVIAF